MNRYKLCFLHTFRLQTYTTESCVLPDKHNNKTTLYDMVGSNLRDYEVELRYAMDLSTVDINPLSHPLPYNAWDIHAFMKCYYYRNNTPLCKTYIM